MKRSDLLKQRHSKTHQFSQFVAATTRYTFNTSIESHRQLVYGEVETRKEEGRQVAQLWPEYQRKYAKGQGNREREIAEKAIRTWAIAGYYRDVRDVSSIILIASDKRYYSFQPLAISNCATRAQRAEQVDTFLTFLPLLIECNLDLISLFLKLSFNFALVMENFRLTPMSDQTRT